MANCTDVNCGHPATDHVMSVLGRPAHAGGGGVIGAGCCRCVGKPSGAAQCKGFALASAVCTNPNCGHPIVNHGGLGRTCYDCSHKPGKNCPGGAW